MTGKIKFILCHTGYPLVYISGWGTASKVQLVLFTHRCCSNGKLHRASRVRIQSVGSIAQLVGRRYIKPKARGSNPGEVASFSPLPDFRAYRMFYIYIASCHCRLHNNNNVAIYIAPYARASKRFTILPLVIGIAHHPHIRGYAADRDQRDLTSHTSQVPN